MLEESFTSVAAWSFPAAVTIRVMAPLRAEIAWIAIGGCGRGRSEATVTPATTSTNETAAIRFGQLIRMGGGVRARTGRSAGEGRSAGSGTGFGTGLCVAI